MLKKKEGAVSVSREAKQLRKVLKILCHSTPPDTLSKVPTASCSQTLQTTGQVSEFEMTETSPGTGNRHLRFPCPNISKVNGTILNKLQVKEETTREWESNQFNKNRT